jgi:hypothetical protein
MAVANTKTATTLAATAAKVAVAIRGKLEFQRLAREEAMGSMSDRYNEGHGQLKMRNCRHRALNESLRAIKAYGSRSQTL